MKFWRRKHGDRSNGKTPKKPLVYLQRQHAMCTPIVYVACQTVDFGPDSRDEVTAIRRSGRTRGTVLQHLYLDTVTSVFKIDNELANQIWDELFPDENRIPPRKPTHFLEVGILDGRTRARSPILKTAVCFLTPCRDSNHCAAEVAGFLMWQFKEWTPRDFEGLKPDAVTPQAIWLLQCIASKWKRLRVV